MNSPVFLGLLLGSLIFSSATRAQELTTENIENIRAKLKTLGDNLNAHVSTRNSSAGQQFAAAAADPRAAMELYLNCHKVVNYEREGRPESDFRAWKDSQEDRIKNDGFIESLLLQLRYLALSCEAAEAEDPSVVFTKLLSFVDSLSNMEEMPTSSLTSSVSGSIFAKAFYLDKLLGTNESWESTPFNIGGIYDKTIFPHLRTENTASLPGAWDKRIEQQSRIVMMIEGHKEDELRGKDRDEERKVRNNQARQGGMFRDLDKDDYIARTLPILKWGKMKDVFTYVSETQGAQAMLPFVEEHLTHELGEQFYREFVELINMAQTGSNQLPGDTGSDN